MPGVYFLEIDGLAHDVLRRAIRDGNAPNLARWVHDGSHHLIRWETDWSSQTGACQAGLLHGDNDDIPAFRWWEKDRGAPIVTNHPRDAAEIERRHSNGRGLLHADGASRANIVSGDAVHTLLTMSTVLDRDRPGRIGQDYFAYFANPYSVTRTIALVIADIAQERRFAAQQRRQDVRPRIQRDRKYALVRAWGTVVQTDLQVQAVIADLYAGRPVGYSTFLAYDEVAHHSGVERTDALAVLRRVDRQIGRIAAAAEDAAAPLPVRRPLRPRPVAGRDVPRPLRRLARGPGPGGLRRRGRRGRARPLGRGARLPERLADGGRRPPTRRRAAPSRRRRGGGKVDGAVQLGEDRRRRRGGRRAARALGHGVGLPRPDHVPARAGPRDARADRGALAGAHPDAARAPRDRLPARPLGAPRRGRARSPAASTTSTSSASRARTRWRPSGPTPRGTSSAPTASRTARTSC